MLYKVTVGRDVYLGTPEEVLSFMAKADGAPVGGAADAAEYMRGIAARVAIAAKGGPRAAVDTSSAIAFLHSLAAAHLLRIEQRHEASDERVDRATALGDGPVAFGGKVDYDDLKDVIDEEE